MIGQLRSIAMVVALGASGCTTPYMTPNIEAMEPTTGAFAGLRSLAPGKPLKVLVVHGMCSHNFTWVREWTEAMEQTFGSPGVAGPRSRVGLIETARFDFADGGRMVEATFVVWSPATEVAKKSLTYDSGSEFPYKRAKFNGIAKSILINNCFADPVIYSGSLKRGTVGEALRRDMAGVVCIFLGGSWNREVCSGGDSAPDRAFITESLGSKLVFDAVAQLAGLDSSMTALLKDALGQTRAIYMLANQLPLLRLAEVEAPTSHVEPSELRWFGPSASRVAAAGAPALQVVAFTDPNDQFSYRLTYPSLGADPKRVALFNVIVSNAKTYFGLAENPYPAHVGYWENPSVPPLVLKGNEQKR